MGVKYQLVCIKYYINKYEYISLLDVNSYLIVLMIGTRYAQITVAYKV